MKLSYLIATIAIGALAMSARPALAQGADSKFPFSYTLTAAFAADAPDTTYVVDVGEAASVTVTVNTTCTVQNNDLVSSRTGTFTTYAEAILVLLSPRTVYIDQTHSTSRGSKTLGPNASLDLGNDQATDSTDCGVGTYQAQGWAGNYESSTDFFCELWKATAGVNVTN